jgi:hypothetical protein
VDQQKVHTQTSKWIQDSIGGDYSTTPADLECLQRQCCGNGSIIWSFLVYDKKKDKDNIKTCLDNWIKYDNIIRASFI